MILFPITFNAAITPSADDVLHRLSSFVAKANTLSAEMKLTANGRMKGPGFARLVYTRPDKLNYVVHWEVAQYRFVGNPNWSWDANYMSMAYDDVADWNRLERPRSRISQMPGDYFPVILLDGSMKQDGIRQVSYSGREKINGVLTDHLRGTGHFVKADLYVALDGKPVRYVVARQGNPVFTGDFAKIERNSPVAPDNYSTTPPLGFKEESVPFGWRPLGLGDPFPFSGLRGPDGQSLKDAVSAAPLLVMLTEEDCGPSSRSVQSLDRIKRSGLQVAITSISDNGGVPEALRAFPVYTDPSKRFAGKMHAPGTPVFYLLGKGGQIVKVWYGYDPDHAQEFETDVADTLKHGNSNDSP